jgi:hypothetical protein
MILLKKHITLIFCAIALLISTHSFAQVVKAEYFVDTDPGQGNGITLSTADGSLDSIVETIFANGINVGSIGAHSLNVRVKDINGTWGPLFKTIFFTQATFVSRNTNVAQAELFWDTDPGQGNGTSVLALDGNFDNAIEAVVNGSLNAPAVGMHKLCVRVKDAAGTWGPLFTTTVKVENVLATRSIKVAQAELFWDTDPGQGNGTSVLALDGNFDSAVEAVVNGSLNAPAVGMHKLCVRVKDAAGTWGPLFTTTVKAENVLAPRSIKVAQAELFWDTDPGQGNGTSVLALDGNFDNAIESIINGSLNAPAVGMHKLCVRVKDAAGTWGPIFTTTVKVENNLIPRSIKVAQAEMYFDVDPGMGNGIAVLALDGNFDNEIEALNQNWQFLPDTGFHKLSVRVKDVAGTWGPSFTTVVHILPCTSAPVVSISPTGTVNICPGDSSLFTATAGFSSYMWFNGNTIVGTGSTYYAKTSGFYKVYIKDASGCAANSAVTQVNVSAVNAVITPLGSTTLCQGTSVTLDAGAGYTTYTWSTGAHTQTITVNSAGTFTVSVSSGSCSGVSSPVSVTVNPLPVVSFTLNPDSVCINTAAYALTGGSPAGGIYSGAGVSGGIFTASVAGVGTHNIVYSYTDGDNCTNTSTKAMYVDVCAGIEGYETLTSSIYPNPFSQTTTISLSGDISNLYFSVCDALGREINKMKVEKPVFTIDANELDNGIYFIHFMREQKVISFYKIIVQK